MSNLTLPNSNLNSFIHAPITIIRSVEVYTYLYNGYKGDPKKALLKTASISRLE